MDSKSIGLCPQGFESPRCRLVDLDLCACALCWLGRCLAALQRRGELARRARSCRRQKTKGPQQTFRLFWISFVFLFCFGWVGAWLLGGGVGGLPAGQGAAAGKKRKVPKKLLGCFGFCLCFCFVLAGSVPGCSPAGWLASIAHGGHFAIIVK